MLVLLVTFNYTAVWLILYVIKKLHPGMIKDWQNIQMSLGAISASELLKA